MDDSNLRARHPHSMRQAFLWALFPTLLLVLDAPDTTYAQVVTNITPTTTAPLDLGTNVDTVGSTTQITGGTRPGSGTNLFHSFDSFTLGTGNTAHFLNDMQLPTNNIIGRVIGGEVSTIDGTLQTNNPLNAADPMNFGAANLWLVNPSGLLLGPNARVEVGGSVSMSTANYLRFEFEGTSAVFDMLSSPASLGPLSVAPVVAFGFLGPDPPAPIRSRVACSKFRKAKPCRWWAETLLFRLEPSRTARCKPLTFARQAARSICCLWPRLARCLSPASRPVRTSMAHPSLRWAR